MNILLPTSELKLSPHGIWLHLLDNLSSEVKADTMIVFKSNIIFSSQFSSSCHHIEIETAQHLQPADIVLDVIESAQTMRMRGNPEGMTGSMITHRLWRKWVRRRSQRMIICELGVSS